jgi:hypothetical protein
MVIRPDPTRCAEALALHDFPSCGAVLSVGADARLQGNRSRTGGTPGFRKTG